MQADGSVIIDTHIETADFDKGISVLKKEVSGLTGELSSLGDRAKLALQKQMDSLEKLYHSYGRQEQKVEQLRKSVEEYGKAHIPTEEYKEIEAQIARDTANLNRLTEAQERFVNSGGKEDSATYKRRAEDIEQLRKSIEYANSELRELEETGGAFTLGASTEKYAQDMQRLAAEEEKLLDTGNRIKTSYTALAQTINEYRQQEDAAADSAGETASYMNLLQSSINGIQMAMRGAVAMFQLIAITAPVKTFSLLRKLAGKLAAALIKIAKSGISSGFRKITAAVKKLALALTGANREGKKTGDTFGSGLKTMLKYGLGIRSVFVLFNRLRSAMVEGFQNLAQYDNATNSSISMLKSSLTQLKNSFATAFAPVLTVVAPILTAFINMVSRAVTSIGMLVAALTGQSSFTKAVAVQEDYAASLGDTAGAADDAAKSTKKAEKATQGYLSGLDEINRYTSNDKEDSGSGSTPSVPGYKAPTPGEMFETVPIESGLKGLADKIRDLVQSEDWAGLGAFIASGINEGLQKVYDAINWNKVGPKITYFVDAFTSTLNSLVDNLDWDLLGRTIGAGVDTIVNTLNRLIEGIDWVAIGNGFAAGVNGLAREVNFENVGRLIGNKFMILPNILLGFVQKLDWSLIGTQIGNALNGVVSSVDLSVIGQMLGVGLTGIFQAAIDFSRTFDWHALGTNIYQGINTFFASTDWATVGQGISDFVIGLLDALIVAVEGIDWTQFGESVKTAIANIDWTTIANKLFEVLGAALGGLAAFLGGLLGDAVTAAKEYFQGKIEECGGNVVLGILKGIVDGLASIGQWIVDNIFTPIVNGFKKAFGISSPSTVMAELGKFLMEGLFNGISSLIEKVVSIFTGIKDKISAVWEALKTATSTAWNTIKTAMSNVWNGIKTTAGTIFEGIKTTISTVWNTVKTTASTVWNGIKTTISTVWNSIKTAASTVWNGIKTTVTSVWNGLKNSASNIFNNIKSAISTAWENVKSTAIEKWNTIKEKVVGIANGIKETVSGAFSKLKEAVGTAFDGVVSRLKSPINSVIGFINGLIDKINGLIGKVNSALSFDVGFTNPFTGNKVGFSYSMNIPTINHIPYLAKGAVIPPNAPFMAVLGDQRQGNNIEAPENLIRKIIREETGKNNGGFSGTIRIPVILDGRKIFEAVIDEARLKQTVSGRNPFELA